MKFLFTLFLSLGLFSMTVLAQPYTGQDKFHVEMRVFPNPSTSGTFSVEFSKLTRKDVLTVKVYNLIGKEVYRQTISSQQGLFETSIHLGSFPKGIYMLEVSRGDQKQIRRLSFI